MQEILGILLKALVEAVLPLLPRFLADIFDTKETVEINDGPLTNTPDDSILSDDQLDRMLR